MRTDTDLMAHQDGTLDGAQPGKDGPQPGKAGGDKARAKARGRASNAARTGQRRARRENPEAAELVKKLGRPAGVKNRPIWDRLRERLARRVNDKLADPEWFDSLSEHSVTQLLKLVTPGSRAVDTGAGEEELRQHTQECRIHLVVDEGPQRKSKAVDTDETGETVATPGPLSVDDIIERLKGDRQMLTEVLRLCSAEDLLTAVDGDPYGQLAKVIEMSAKRYVEQREKRVREAKEIREVKEARLRQARIFRDPAAWARGALG